MKQRSALAGSGSVFTVTSSARLKQRAGRTARRYREAVGGFRAASCSRLPGGAEPLPHGTYLLSLSACFFSQRDDPRVWSRVALRKLRSREPCLVNDQSFVVTPAAIAGVIRRLRWMRTKL